MEGALPLEPPPHLIDRPLMNRSDPLGRSPHSDEAVPRFAVQSGQAGNHGAKSAGREATCGAESSR
jgi:hypothetical protein